MQYNRTLEQIKVVFHDNLSLYATLHKKTLSSHMYWELK